MFEKKVYFTSCLCMKNTYCVKEELPSPSRYERRVLTKDEYNKEHVILFEKIGNKLPNESDLMFDIIDVHDSILYPEDLIERSNIYVHENEIGFVYKKAFLYFDSFDGILSSCNKNDKVAFLERLCAVLEDIHRNNIFLNGFDKKQILIKGDTVQFRYNGFKNHNRNSIYRVPDFFARDYSETPWILDVFSLVAIIFECMYEWKPFFGNMTSFSEDEEHQFDVFYNNFRKKIFIFERENKLNEIGFLVNQRPIVEKWSETDEHICDFFHNILTMDIPKEYTQEFVFEEIHKLIDYYKNTEIFQ